MKILSLISIIVLASACATVPNEKESGGAPSWVSHPEQAYPEQRFFTSVGMGGSREEAIRDARRQMAEAFLVKVQSSTQVNADSKLNESTSGSVSGASSQNVNQSLNMESEARLRGAEVKEVAQVGSDIYVLLALDKLSARSGLMLQANRLQSKISANLDELESTFSGQKMKELNLDMEDLRALSGEASTLGMSALVDLGALEARVQTLQGKLRSKNDSKQFSVKTQKGDERFARALEECLQDRGARVYTGEKVPEGTNQVALTSIEQSQHLQVEGWVKSKFVVTANLVDSNGRSFRATEEKLETARTHEALLEAVSSEISNNLCEKVWNRIGEMK
jgi:hypothetical protein